MIVRTYGRRTRCPSRGFSDALDGGGGAEDDDLDEPLSLSSQEAGSSHDPYGFVAFSQESSPWSLDSDLLLLGSDDNPSATAPLLLPPPPPLPGNSTNGQQHRKQKNTQIVKKPEPVGPSRPKSPPALAPVATATLMEAQEFGEMMEHVDEVNFALDGFRPGQPVRIRRASLLSLLSICATAHQRRLLRAQGMAKKIIDAVLCLSFDDSPSNVAAAALFYVLGQDDHLLDSSSCIQFLLKLLNPPMVDMAEDKVPIIGCRLLGIRNSGTLSSTNKRLDSSSTEIISKVEEVLLSCKEIKPVFGEEATGRPELSSKWISLLTMEKACLSTVSLEDTSGTVRRVGGNFKERLRELGGLDAIFEVAKSCHSTMKGWLRHGFPSFWELKDGIDLQSVVLFLKCLKIMENATFLSKENQNHLLGMKAKLKHQVPMSFVGLVISSIKIISDLSLCQTSPSVSKKKSSCFSEVMTQFRNASEVQPTESCKDDSNGTSTSGSAGCSVPEKSSDTKRYEAHQKRQRISTSQWEFPSSDPKLTIASGSDVCSIKKRTGSKGEVSINVNDSRTNSIRGSNGRVSINISSSKMKSTGVRNDQTSLNANGPRMDSISGSNDLLYVNSIDPKLNPVSLRKRPHSFEEAKDEVQMGSNDPFAFDEDELEPTKWETLAKKKETSEIHPSTFTNRRLQDRSELHLPSSNPESTNEDDQQSCEDSIPLVTEEDSNLLEDCLLTSVKVLMNLTNDNPLGCQQIAACGGLDTMASLIINHFPSFDSFISMHDHLEDNILVLEQSSDSGHLNNKQLSDHEIDFLVAILGLLVNLVEKDSRNRSRLASTSIPVARSVKSGDKENHKHVIPLLCSIFLANRGTEAAAGEGLLECIDDAALLQGEREAEMMIIEAYAALLLAFLSTESETSREAIAGCLPDNNLEILVPVLERFVAFHLSLNMISPETHSTVSEVIESCKAR